MVYVVFICFTCVCLVSCVAVVVLFTWWFVKRGLVIVLVLIDYCVMVLLRLWGLILVLFCCLFVCMYLVVSFEQFSDSDFNMWLAVVVHFICLVGCCLRGWVFDCLFVGLMWLFAINVCLLLGGSVLIVSFNSVVSIAMYCVLQVILLFSLLCLFSIFVICLCCCLLVIYLVWLLLGYGSLIRFCWVYLFDYCWWVCLGVWFDVCECCCCFVLFGVGCLGLAW